MQNQLAVWTCSAHTLLQLLRLYCCCRADAAAGMTTTNHMPVLLLLSRWQPCSQQSRPHTHLVA
jgi:hypothetical protein